jgi:DNA-binding NarL/FixJ family response regulator
MRVAIIIDQPLCRDALCRLVEAELAPAAVAAYPTVKAFRADGGPPPELLIFDPPHTADFSTSLRQLGEVIRQAVSVVMIPVPNQVLARIARLHGFRGVMPKTSEVAVMAAALRLVLAGGEYFPCFDEEGAGSGPAPAAPGPAPLSRRQAEILAELEVGATNKEIARKLGISLATVKMHVRALLTLSNARNRTEAVSRLRTSR